MSICYWQRKCLPERKWECVCVRLYSTATSGPNLSQIKWSDVLCLFCQSPPNGRFTCTHTQITFQRLLADTFLPTMSNPNHVNEQHRQRKAHDEAQHDLKSQPGSHETFSERSCRNNKVFDQHYKNIPNKYQTINRDIQKQHFQYLMGMLAKQCND